MVLDLYVYNMFLLTSNFIVASSVSCTLTTSTSSQALSLFLALSKYPLNIWRIDLTGPGCVSLSGGKGIADGIRRQEWLTYYYLGFRL